MLRFPDHGEFLRQGGRRKCSVHKENPCQWWLHINGHRSKAGRNERAHDSRVSRLRNESSN